jgi:hypothetical protein
VIQSNGGDGIGVLRGSICCNTISNNLGGAIGVARGAQADIANNAIDQNAADGITVGDMSTVTLGRNSGRRRPSGNAEWHERPEQLQPRPVLSGQPEPLNRLTPRPRRRSIEQGST